MTTDTGDPAHQPASGFDQVIASLRRLRAAARRLLLTRAIAMIAAGLLLLFTATGMLDFLLRFPIWMRTGHLLVGAGLLLFVYFRYIRPALRFHPSLTSIALRIEDHNPDLRDLLASGVEFDSADNKHATAMESGLSDRVIERAANNYSASAARTLLNKAPARRAIALLTFSILFIAALAAVNTNLATIGAKRTLTPWAGAEWPKRTGVADATDTAVHPIGVVLPLRAVVTKANRAIERTDVVARYRPIVSGKAGASQRILLTWQGRDEVTTAGATGAFFERLIEADADAIEYRFETEDDETEWKRILLVEPPHVASASAVITPPAYASAIPAGAFTAQAQIDMGQGADERAIAPPALLGSTIDLTLAFNKPIPIDAGNPDWLAATFTPDIASTAATITPAQGSADSITISWSLAQTTRLPVALVDEHGITSPDESVFRFDAVEDQAPAATVTAPPSDTAVLATAILDITGEGRDDVGLAWVRLDQQLLRPEGADDGNPSGPGGAMAPTSEPTQIAIIESVGEATAEVITTLKLQTLGVAVGDEVHLTAIAADVYAAADLSRAPTISTPRRLRIVSEEEFVRAIRNELSGVRQSVIRIDERQRTARTHKDDSGADQTAIKEQANITDRVAREIDSVEQVQSRLEQNQLGDERLNELLSDVRQSLEQARAASTQAADALDQMAEQQDANADNDNEDNEQSQEERAAEQAADDAQREVMDRLEDVAAQLDTGEDAWVLQRSLEKMLEAQRQLQEQTQQLGSKTAGKSASELSQSEQSELEAIVKAQEDLAQQADELADEMREREEQLSETDQTAAAGLSEAARRAQEERVSETMEQAAGEASQNQTSSASKSQQQAAESLERMLEDLEEGQRAREAALRRILASLIESLEALVNQQTSALASLSQTIIDGGPIATLDQGMIRLNTNTLGVLDLARNAGRELAPVANLVSDASAAQSRAIVELRREQIENDAVREHESRSLDLLTRALEEAQRLEDEMQQQEQDRKKAELLKAYRDALTAQIALRDETEAFGDKENLTRRDRAALRGIADEQDSIREALEIILESTEELADAEVFTFAHTRLSNLTESASTNLRDTQPVAAARRQTAAVAVLQGIVESLQEDAPPKDDNFNDGAGGGSGDSGGQQPQELLPPIAQLRLLRQMQSDLLTRTRLTDELPGEPGVESPEELGAEQRQLGDIGGGIIEKMSEQSGSGPGEMPIQPE